MFCDVLGVPYPALYTSLAQETVRNFRSSRKQGVGEKKEETRR